MSGFSITIVSLFGIVFAVGLPVSIPIVWLVLRHRRYTKLIELHHTERMAAIDRGMELPPLPVEMFQRPANTRTVLLPALIWLMLGLSTWIALAALEGQHALLGLIPASVGVAHLVYYFIDERRRAASDEVRPATETPLPARTERNA